MNLMVVAHPDDETLFGSAQLSDQWLVVCVTNGDNPIRCGEFQRAMTTIGAKFLIWDYKDIYNQPLDESRLIPQLQEIIKQQIWDKIVTHGSGGEYGHRHHKQLYQIMSKLVDELWCFDLYGHPLSDEQWQRKLDLLKIYESQKLVCDRLIPFVRDEHLVRARSLI